MIRKANDTYATELHHRSQLSQPWHKRPLWQLLPKIKLLQDANKADKRTQKVSVIHLQGSNCSGIQCLHSGTGILAAAPLTVFTIISHYKSESVLSMRLNTSANATVKELNCLKNTGLSHHDHEPPSEGPRYMANGSQMAPALGLLKMNMS